MKIGVASSQLSSNGWCMGIMRRSSWILVVYEASLEINRILNTYAYCILMFFVGECNDWRMEFCKNQLEILLFV